MSKDASRITLSSEFNQSSQLEENPIEDCGHSRMLSKDNFQVIEEFSIEKKNVHKRTFTYKYGRSGNETSILVKSVKENKDTQIDSTILKNIIIELSLGPPSFNYNNEKNIVRTLVQLSNWYNTILQENTHLVLPHLPSLGFTSTLRPSKPQLIQLRASLQLFFDKITEKEELTNSPSYIDFFEGKELKVSHGKALISSVFINAKNMAVNCSTFLRKEILDRVKQQEPSTDTDELSVQLISFHSELLSYIETLKQTIKNLREIIDDCAGLLVPKPVPLNDPSDLDLDVLYKEFTSKTDLLSSKFKARSSRISQFTLLHLNDLLGDLLHCSSRVDKRIEKRTHSIRCSAEQDRHEIIDNEDRYLCAELAAFSEQINDGMKFLIEDYFNHL